jgi:DNA modification methylase
MGGQHVPSHTVQAATIAVEYVEPSALRPAKYNPRTISEKELADLGRSVGEFGLVDPIIARRADHTVIGGHQRLAVAERLGLQRVPVIYLDVSEGQAKLLNVALNKIRGDWDEQKLAELLRELEPLPDLDLSVTGFDEGNIRALLATVEAQPFRNKEEDFDVEAAIEEARKSTRVRLGEVWALGRHRLACGDATLGPDVDRLLAGDTGDLVVTNPPYNVDYRAEGSPSGRAPGRNGKGRRGQPLGPIEDDWMTPGEYQAFLNSSFGNLARALPRGGAVYVFGGTGTFVPYDQAFKAAGLHLSSIIVWDKGSLVLTRKDYHSQYELIFYGWVAGKPHTFHGGRGQTDIWAVSRDYPREYLHPTQKPVELVERAIENSSRPGQTLLDPFVGSGAAIVAAERTGRRCLAMEIDPCFAEVALRRWEAFTGKAAQKVT